jgi:hypothetical protein
VDIGSPSAVLVAVLDVFVAEADEAVDDFVAVLAAAEELDAVDDAVVLDVAAASGTVAACVWKPSTAPMPATVAVMTIGARRMSAAPQKVNDSKWIWPLGTPACSRAPASAAVNASGPQM